MGGVLVVVHHHREEASNLARELVAHLSAAGRTAYLPAQDAALLGLAPYGVEDLTTVDVDLAVSVGGDGTMLRTVDLVAAQDVPVFGVHVGQLGYLVEVEPSATYEAVTRFFSGDFTIQERMRLQVHVEGAPDLGGTALNEAVLEKAPLGHTVRLGVSVDGAHFTTYTADGLIVATPTGSTAYSLSARAPIVAPGHRALVLTPVAPHSLFDRSLVLDPNSLVRVEVTSYRPAKVFLDGRDAASLDEGMAVICTASPHPARFVTFEPRSFLGILKAKFGLLDR